MAVTGRLADIAQKSAVLFLAGTTVYYMVNVGVLVNRRMELKKQGKLHEELARLNGLMEQSENTSIHAETSTTPTPLPDTDTPGTVKEL
ncbi:hypothetical protein G6F57_002386 [Rhizopus arrhizus]|uniref:Uncharacterized protein n=1 Tax=Rhizopus oryzae TaxID=64495 RepID=A0A9P6XHE2_RHIOR|nr:hypothetical protein G6F23_004761 [Rhizopus arrhizus]KAG1424370.1 hypothetical protein G6F58_002409 [Rhizopus delemar]KAG0760760.1 hypothetical protein G6F24_008077 [Rhizopus arrhizus]KAG0787140.1 hypothetical protein G6F21_008110 [Rhizopus arrhizus]KAG0800449.1 hypothetical protein G6F22_002224 [Rhizopus arrhizus]